MLSPVLPADAADVAAVFVALESSFYGSSALSVADVTDEWADMDLARDALVVRDGGRVVAYGGLHLRGDVAQADGCVHPAAHGRGIGRALVCGLEDLAAARGAERIHNRVLEADGAARALLEASDYRLVRVFRELRIELDGPPSAPVWQDGLRVVPFDPERDAHAFHAAQQEAFADHWEFEPQDFASWADRYLGVERFDPALWCVVRDGEDIVAGTICAGDTYGGGFVHALFTRRPWRGRGVGAALLSDAFGRLWAHGERSVGLGVDAANPTGAFRLYERAGMSPVLGWTVHEKSLRGPGA